MPTLPVELFGLIIIAAQYAYKQHTSFRSLRLVCRHFDYLALPYVFRRLDFGASPTARLKSPIDRIRRYLKLSRSRHELMPCATLITFHVQSGLNTEDQSWLEDRLVSTLMRRVGRTGKLARLAIFVYSRRSTIRGDAIVPLITPVASSLRSLYLKGLPDIPSETFHLLSNLRKLKAEESSVRSMDRQSPLPLHRPRIQSITYCSWEAECPVAPLAETMDFSCLQELAFRTTNSCAIAAHMMLASDGWASIRKLTLDISSLDGERDLKKPLTTTLTLRRVSASPRNTFTSHAKATRTGTLSIL
jgi:hypothetical protein